MVSLQSVRYINVTPPASITGAVTTASIDTVQNGVKFDYLTVVVYIGALTVDLTSLKLQTSDTDGSYADLTGFVGGTDFTLPTATDDNKFVVFNVDLRGKKRYFDVVANTGAAACVMSIAAILSRGKIGPNSADDSNVLALVNG